MEIMHLTEKDFSSQTGSGTVLVDFWATWCGPCRMLAPTVEAFAQANPEIKVCKVDVDEARELAIRFGINTIPTLMVFRDGTPVKQSIGVISLEEIESLVNS